MALTRLRWILWRPGAPDFSGAEELVDGACRAAAAAAESHGARHTLYISKHGTSEAWFTVIVDASHAIQVTGVVEPALDPYPRRPDHTSDPHLEPLLDARCVTFRQDLDSWTRVGLDLHGTTPLADTQRELIRLSRGSRIDRGVIEPFLNRLSPHYRALQDKDGLCSRAATACIPNTDSIHWLYSIVLGLDDFTGTEPEAAFRAQLGL